MKLCQWSDIKFLLKGIVTDLKPDFEVKELIGNGEWVIFMVSGGDKRFLKC